MDQALLVFAFASSPVFKCVQSEDGVYAFRNSALDAVKPHDRAMVLIKVENNRSFKRASWKVSAE